MRKALMSMLLAATVFVPVAAQAQTADPAVLERYRRLEQQNQERYGRQQERAERREERQDRRENRGERREERRENRVERREDRVERRAERREDRVEQRRDRSIYPEAWQGNPNDPRMEAMRRRYQQLERQNQREYRQDRREDRREWRQDRREDRREWRQERRDLRNWDRNWRYDRRYNWNNWRSSNRHIYRLPPYYAPYRGHSYSRIGIGVTLGRPFWSDYYWIRDPYQYRLPYAPAGTRWVRYYDDVLLIDTWTGEVLDVVYNFFW